MLNHMMSDILGKATDCEIVWDVIMRLKRKSQKSDRIKYRRTRNSNPGTNYQVLLDAHIRGTADVNTSKMSIAYSGGVAVSHKNSNEMHSVFLVCSTVASGQINVGMGAL
jgi:hypothetical protein